MWTYRVLVAMAAGMLVSCSSQKNASETSSQLSPMQLAAGYVPRLGVAVRTESRTCAAIKNANLANNSPITLVVPTVPQSFLQAQIKTVSEDACPITKERDASVTSYEINLPPGSSGLRKMVPMIAIVGDASGFLATNITVQADLDHDRHPKMFRACSSNDGVHLTVWSGTPLSSDLLWHGFYSDSGSAGAAPACTAKEASGA